jgi:hypothetical protein
MSKQDQNSSGAGDFERHHFDDWALMNRICMEPPVGGRNAEYEAYVSNRKVDRYSTDNAQHLLVYARDIAQEPIKGFEKHIMTNPQVVLDYRRFKDEWDRKNGGGGTSGLMRTLAMRIGQAVGRRKAKEEQQAEIEPIKRDPFERARTLVANDPAGSLNYNEAKIEAIDYRLRLVEALQALRPGSTIPDDWVDAEGKKQSGSYSIEGGNLVLVRQDGNDDRVWSIDRPFELSKRKSQIQIDRELRAVEEAAEAVRKEAARVASNERLQRQIESLDRRSAWRDANKENLTEYLEAHPEGIADTFGSLYKLSEDGSTVTRTTTYGKVTSTPVGEFRATENQRLEREMQKSHTISRGMSM